MPKQVCPNYGPFITKAKLKVILKSQCNKQAQKHKNPQHIQGIWSRQVVQNENKGRKRIQQCFPLQRYLKLSQHWIIHLKTLFIRHFEHPEVSTILTQYSKHNEFPYFCKSLYVVEALPSYAAFHLSLEVRALSWESRFLQLSSWKV